MAVVQLMVMRGSYPRILHLIPHQYLEYPTVEFVAPVALVHEDIFAHAIQTLTVASLLVVTDDHRHHPMNRNKLRLGW